jgi:hypothetical protein
LRKFAFRSSGLWHHLLILVIWISLPSTGLLWTIFRFSWWYVGAWCHFLARYLLYIISRILLSFTSSYFTSVCWCTHTHTCTVMCACMCVSEWVSLCSLITVAVVSCASPCTLLHGWTQLMNDLFCCCWVNIYKFPQTGKLWIDFTTILQNKNYCVTAQCQKQTENVIPVGKSHI